MGIFTKKTKDERQIRTEALVKSLAANSNQYVRDLSTRLFNLVHNPASAVMKPVYLYTDCIEMMMSNIKNFDPKDYAKALEYGEQVYKDVFVYEEDTPEFDELETVFIELFDVNSAISKHCFEGGFFHLFKNKHNYVKWLRSLANYSNIQKINSLVLEYASMAKSFFTDEDAFTAQMIEFSLKLLKSPNPEEVYAKEAENIYHMVGIYNVDEARIMGVEQKLDSTEALLAQTTALLAQADQKLKSIDSITTNSYEKVKQLCENEVQVASGELSHLKDKINAAYDSFLNEQRQIVLYEKEKFLNEIFADAEAKVRSIKDSSTLAISSANEKLMQINQESGLVMSKLDNYFKDDERLKKVIGNAAVTENLMNKIDKLMILNDQNIEGMVAATVQQPMQQEAKVVVQTVKEPVEVVKEEVVIADAEEEKVTMTVNPYLDENVSFDKRWKMVQERKKKMQDQGVHFHEMFDDVLIAVMENANPYLIGPTGCGKTYMIAQIAKILDLDFIDIGYINEEYDILGFQTANGGYSKPNFYRCYKYGKIAFCDELDNGNSKATVKLNSFLSNVSDASYNFPHGENVKRHPNFRMIAAGNTAGNGADINYNTREKIEESVQQRLLPINVGYDNAVEKKILKDYKNWYEFIVLFRRATDAWGAGNFSDAPGIITTRDAARIKKYLSHNSFNDEKILEYEFIQTKEIGYLTFLSEFMTKNVKKDNPANVLVKTFAVKVEERR